MHRLKWFGGLKIRTFKFKNDLHMICTAAECCLSMSALDTTSSISRRQEDLLRCAFERRSTNSITVLLVVDGACGDKTTTSPAA